MKIAVPTYQSCMQFDCLENPWEWLHEADFIESEDSMQRGSLIFLTKATDLHMHEA